MEEMGETQDNQVTNIPTSPPIINQQNSPDTQSIPQPVPQQQIPEPQQPPTVPQQANIGLMVLQWLTYAFWGWTVLALSVLTTTVLAFYINKADVGGFTPYGIAAILVLLPIAFVCDSFYVKREPIKKQGAEIAITIIHAVIFAIFGVGALIGAVISVVTIFTSISDTTVSITSLLSLLIIALYYSLAFIRTINIQKISWFNRNYRFIMIASVGIIALLGIIGPTALERSTRDDRLIEGRLSDVKSSINNYYEDKNELPSELNQVSFTGDAKKIVDQNLVTYKPEGVTQNNIDLNSLKNYSSRYTQYNEYAKYQLCVNYKKESAGYNSSSSNYIKRDYEDYNTYLSTSTHPAGEVCYKIKTNY